MNKFNNHIIFSCLIYLNNFYFYIPLIIVYIQSNKEIINTNHNIYYKKDGIR